MDGSDKEQDAIHHLLTAHFSVFRRLQDDEDVADQMPLPPPVLQRYGLVPSQVRMVELAGAARVWLTPCCRGAALSRENIPAHGRGSSFGSVEAVCSRGLWGLTEDLQGRRWLTGLVPDGNPVVCLELHDGEEHVVPTVQGVVVVKELERVQAIAFQDAAGSSQRQTC